MTAIMMPHFELPLLGSNQDSPDPESGASTGGAATTCLESQPNRGEAGPKHRENTHEKPHTICRRAEYQRDWKVGKTRGCWAVGRVRRGVSQIDKLGGAA